MKLKNIIVILSVFLIFTSFTMTSNANNIRLGDINKDGNVSAWDARMVLRVSAKLDKITDEDRVYADVNFDSRVNAVDARMVLRAAAKIEALPEMPSEETTTEKVTIPGVQNYKGHVYTGGAYSKKYHYESECAGKNSNEITWDDVKSRGLGPCGTCVLK